MGYLGYEFVNLSKEQVAARRVSLDHHAFIAQASQLAVLLMLVLFKLTCTLVTRWTSGDTESAPSSPQKKYLAEGREKSFVTKVASRWRIFNWRLDSDVVRGYGTWKQWIGGLLWSAWLGALCFQGTAPDYMDFTKRFGLVAASQLPLHYLLAMKTPYSPLQILLRTSHENLNAVHQVLGRVVAVFMVLHAACYVNFFILTGFWVKRFKDVDVLLGLTSATLVILIGSTAMGSVRRRNYRLFFLIHSTAPIILLGLLYFHVRYIRVYVLESMAFALLNIGMRTINFKHVTAELQKIEGTSLVRISAPRQIFRRIWAPGNHVYLRNAIGWRSYFYANPFTISTLSIDQESELVLVARVLQGSTKSIARIAQSQGRQAESQAVPLPVIIEGPYGQSKHLPDLKTFERILFVAGGVGATYIMPVLQHAEKLRSTSSLNYQDFKLVWSVKQKEDAFWALHSLSKPDAHASSSDERELYITGSNATSTGDDSAVELSSRTDMDKSRSAFDSLGFTTSQGRPDFRQIVDQCFAGHTGHVAVVVCGPAGMTSALKRHVGRWIVKGRDVYWHAEEFGL